MGVFAVLLYLLLRLQGHLPLNPDGMKGVLPHISMNTTASFITNTNWQYYGGEFTMSYLSQMAGSPCRISSRRHSAWPSSWL
jgi:K+-transporting ATPase ATPase A chain